MGWAYLAVSINGAAYTLNVFRPVRRNRWLMGWTFFASWLTIELAPFMLLGQVVGTFFFARRGALRTAPGRAGFLLTLASWGGLAVSIRQSIRARHEIREELRHIRDDEPLPSGPVATRRGVHFARAGGRNLRMDIVAPAGDAAPDTPRPVLVQVHGGGWVIGFKERQGRLLMRRMAAAGWVCCNVDYRLSPMATFPDHLVDVKRAIAWIREHAAELGIDPGFVAVTGGSAGGHLTALAALTAADRSLQPGFEEADCSVQAAVPFYGVYDFTNRTGSWPQETIEAFFAPIVMKCSPEDDPQAWADASPMDRVNADAPPFLVIHGDLDVLAPVKDAREFVRLLRDVSGEPVHYLELHGAQHAFETFASLRANAVVDAAARWLVGVHESYASHGNVLRASEVDEAVTETLGHDLADDVRPHDARPH